MSIGLQIERHVAPVYLTRGLLVGLALGVGVVAFGVHAVTRAHALSEVREERCRVRLEAVVRANQILRKGYFPVLGHCRNLTALTGETIR